jgi:hypothetical protein
VIYIYKEMNKDINKQMSNFKRKQTRNTNKLPPKDQLNILSKFIIDNPNTRSLSYELEAKFGTRGIKPISKIDYDNVVKKLISLGYTTNNSQGTYTLKIQTESITTNDNQYKNINNIDRFRIEISGLSNIQEYCRTDSLKIVNDKSPNSVKILKKTDIKINENSNDIYESADFDDFNFRVSLKKEESINKNSTLLQKILDNWHRSKKVFRYINRVSFKHLDYPFSIDLSIVRSSIQNERGLLIQTNDIQKSNVFNNPPTYEIEVEATSEARMKYKTFEELSQGLQKNIKNILCGLQKTNYPVSYVEQRTILQNYHSLLFEDDYIKKGEQYTPKNYLYPSDFIGPGLVTLDIINIGPINSNIVVPNITEPFAYCVTDKADGDRHLLYVNNVGRIYLINMNMNVIFTGAKTTEERCFNSLIDGELILHDKLLRFINTFAAFDIYYINKTDIRSRPFMQTVLKDPKYFKEGCRLPILKEFVKILNPINILVQDPINSSPIIIIAKDFYPMFDSTESKESAKYNIFEANNYLLTNIADGLFSYNIDGLIFTPTLLGVGSNKFLEAGPKKKITWQYCFKWKPSEATITFPQSYNTIDFLVITKKAPDGTDIITPIFEKGLNTTEQNQYKQYKTLTLAVGFDQTRHGFINPCQDLLDDKFSTQKEIDDEKGYKPKQFMPSNPYDPLAGLCNIMLEIDNNMFTEERQIIEDQMVVEFRYDKTKPGLWKWIPMRVRYDKTADFRANQGVGANDYTTANNNWHTIHYPVTELMIKSGQDIPGIEVSDDVYYNSLTNDNLTQGMRDFHNLFVKKKLIQGVSRKGGILIDFACGKGGDFPKWIASGLAFVFGIDISKDNIENRLNGACARYLSFKKTTETMPYALFVNGNSALNIRSGTNMFNDKANEITKTIFGAPGSKSDLGPAVARQQSRGINGFDVASCQFAMHYMFENKKTFYNFIRNVAECTKLNGYFIATCYDGKTIFNRLRQKMQGESSDIYVDNKKIWSVTKMYESSVFEDDESSLGYKIDVYQDSINQTLSEYLVNFDFLTITMEKYGFALLTREEARQMKMPSGSGMFSELYNSMIYDINKDSSKKSDYKDALDMKDYEKNISFLNRYFIYKKISTRNVEKLTKVLLDQLPDELAFEEKGVELVREVIKKSEANIKPKVKKLKDKLNLREATEAVEEQDKELEQEQDLKIIEKEEINIDNDEDSVVINMPKKRKSRKNKDKN